jgi:hypothetical protein
MFPSMNVSVERFTFPRHVFNAFAMWIVTGNARVNQYTVWSMASHQDAKLELGWWKNLLGALRAANGLG